MDNKQETFAPQIQEKDFGDPITPFDDAYPDQAGKITVKNFALSRHGDLTFIASPNVGSVDTTKFFKNPRRVWVELSLPNQTPEDAVEEIASILEVRVDVRNNNTVTMHGQAEGTKIVFDTVKTGKTENPLIEDRSHLKAMVFEFAGLIGNQPQ